MTIPPDQDGLALRRGTVEWRPSRREAMAMNLAGLLVAVLGMVGYGALAISGHQPAESFVIAGTELLLGLLGMAAAVVGLVVVHEGIHGLAMLPFGARPSFGVGVGGGGLLPYVYTTAPGHLFSRTGYLVVALAPSLLLIVLTVPLVGWTQLGGWLVVPAAFHLGGCVGDWWLVGVAGRQPAGSRYEDLHEGLRIHLPGPSRPARRMFRAGRHALNGFPGVMASVYVVGWAGRHGHGGLEPEARMVECVRISRAGGRG